MKRWILSLALLTLGFTASAQNDLIDRINVSHDTNISGLFK